MEVSVLQQPEVIAAGLCGVDKAEHLTYIVRCLYYM